VNRSILSEKQKLDNLFSLIDVLDYDEELVSHWSRYLCVIVSAFIENALRISINHYVSGKCHPNIIHFVDYHIERITNLNDEKIKTLIGSFSSGWRAILEERITEKQKDAIDSIVANRHLIVHGRSVGITLKRIRDYYQTAIEVVTLIDSEILSN